MINHENMVLNQNINNLPITFFPSLLFLLLTIISRETLLIRKSFLIENTNFSVGLCFFFALAIKMANRKSRQKEN